MSKVDVTITVDKTAAANASNATNATANATAANATAANATVAAGAPAAADDTTAAPVKKGPPMIFWIWGGYSIWVHLSALLTWNAYGTYATNVVAAKVTNNTNWTTSWVKSTKPVSNWILSANVTMFLQTFSIIGWILGVLKMNKPFLMLFKASQLFPAVELLLWLYTYFSYTSCDANTLTATQFDKTTTSVTQLSSCRNPDKTTTTKAQFGTSGTWAAKVNTDPYNTWFLVDVGTAVGSMAVNGMALMPILKAYGPNESNASNATNATAPAGANATATAGANATAGNATANGSNASAAVAAAVSKKDSKKSGGDGIMTVPDLVVDDVEEDNIIAIEENRDADDSKKCDSWWGCL